MPIDPDDEFDFSDTPDYDDPDTAEDDGFEDASPYDDRATVRYMREEDAAGSIYTSKANVTRSAILEEATLEVMRRKGCKTAGYVTIMVFEGAVTVHIEPPGKRPMRVRMEPDDVLMLSSDMLVEDDDIKVTGPAIDGGN